jgi:hypothetical protein
MTRCDEFYQKVEKDGNFCNMDRTAYHRTVEYIVFCRENDVPLGTLSERAARQVIKEKNPVAKAKVIESIKKGVGTSPLPGEEGIRKHIINKTAGENNCAEEHEGAQKDVPKVELSDFIGQEETDPEEAYPFTGNEVSDTGDIPSTPNTILPTPKAIPDVIPAPREIEEDEDPEEEDTPMNQELTEKVIKERLINAGGYKAPAPKPERAPSEGEKQDIFDACVRQASKWGMGGGEIARRMRTSIIFIAREEKGGE